MVYELEDKNEESAFYELDSHRGIAVVGAAIVENRLTAVLRAAMRQDESALQELFRSSGPLGTFGTKIRLAYLLRLIHEDLYNDLLIVTRIRNAFAHDVKISSFEEQSIRAKMRTSKHSRCGKISRRNTGAGLKNNRPILRPV
jgi:DNA-binding MltR family transcriptional regulator